MTHNCLCLKFSRSTSNSSVSSTAGKVGLLSILTLFSKSLMSSNKLYLSAGSKLSIFTLFRLTALCTSFIVGLFPVLLLTTLFVLALYERRFPILLLMLLKLLVYLEAASVGALCGISLFEFGVEKLFISIGDCPSIIIDYTLASLSSVLYETSM